ncbi:MAG: AAA family ATPase [Lachnospiraceae bacterium]
MNENGKWLLSLVPKDPEWMIDWERINGDILTSWVEKMKVTEQNPVWHGEGDVWTHTQMVCEELVKGEKFRNLPRKQQQIVFLAALLHDTGKVVCTRLEDGIWVSPSHTIVGAKLMREFLWKECGMSGTPEDQNFRESICNLIRYHSVPSHLLDYSSPERRLFRIAAQGELAPNFTLYLLQVLVEADMKGRICDTLQDSLDTVELCFVMAEENDILHQAGTFASKATQAAYFSGRQVWREQELFDDTWGEVIVMSGLPGTGKDTWIHNHYPDLPVISLDEIRQELHISAEGNQGAVINLARDRARELLRQHQPFVWNATNLSVTIRQKTLNLIEQYHAATRIVFLETSWEKELTRNKQRQKKVPENVIADMLKKLELPERSEGWDVEWHCV